MTNTRNIIGDSCHIRREIATTKKKNKFIYIQNDIMTQVTTNLEFKRLMSTMILWERTMQNKNFPLATLAAIPCCSLCGLISLKHNKLIMFIVTECRWCRRGFRLMHVQLFSWENIFQKNKLLKIYVRHRHFFTREIFSNFPFSNCLHRL